MPRRQRNLLLNHMDKILRGSLQTHKHLTRLQQCNSVATYRLSTVVHHNTVQLDNVAMAKLTHDGCFTQERDVIALLLGEDSLDSYWHISATL